MESRPRILLAEDHAGIRERVLRLLERQFEIVAVVSDGRAVVDAAIELEPDLVITDILMPEMDGFHVAEELRRRGSQAKVIFLTIQQDEDYAAAALDNGGFAYVLKSRMHLDLVRAVRQALAGHKFVSPLAV